MMHASHACGAPFENHALPCVGRLVTQNRSQTTGAHCKSYGIFLGYQSGKILPSFHGHTASRLASTVLVEEDLRSGKAEDWEA